MSQRTARAVNFQSRGQAIQEHTTIDADIDTVEATVPSFLIVQFDEQTFSSPGTGGAVAMTISGTIGSTPGATLNLPLNRIIFTPGTYAVDMHARFRMDGPFDELDFAAVAAVGPLAVQETTLIRATTPAIAGVDFAQTRSRTVIYTTAPGNFISFNFASIKNTNAVVRLEDTAIAIIRRIV